MRKHASLRFKSRPGLISSHGFYSSLQADLPQLQLRPPPLLPTIALCLAPMMMRAPISMVPVESVAMIGAEPRSVVAIGWANNHANYWRRSIEDRRRRWGRVIVRPSGSTVRLNHFGAGI